MAFGVFVTGTDTGVGKTVVAVALLRALVMQGLRAVGMKPVSAGAAASGRNADVLALEAAANVAAAAELVNPYAFAAAIAPHVAAAQEGRRIELATIVAAYAALAQRADAVVVEGAGGVLVPLDEAHAMLDIPRACGLPVVLVVGVRLGCLNHALLSAEAIRGRGLTLAGWIASRVDPAMPAAQASVDTLVARLRAPLLGDFASVQATCFTADVVALLGAPRGAVGRGA
jgi:dethiobiotin synthetase